MVSKKNGMKGNIIAERGTEILSVLGFNFELNFDKIRENIKKYKRIFKNQEILKYLDLLDIRSVEDIDTMFNNFKNFSEFCEDMIANTTDINEYKAFKELHKAITVRKDMTDLFKMSDGRVAKTYLEYLYDKLPVIAEKIDDMHKDKTGIYIEHVLGKLNELIPELEYLNTINGTNNNIVQTIVGLINFFKSYTVDLRTLNILYMFDNKRFNKIYMIDDPRLFIRLFPHEALPVYNDTLTTALRIDKYNNLIIYDKAAIYNTLRPKDYVGEYDEIVQLINKMEIQDKMELDYKDLIELLTSHMSDNDVIDLRDDNHLYIDISHIEKYNTQHNLVIYNLMNKFDVLQLDYKDSILFIKRIYENDHIPFRCKNEIFNRIFHGDKFTLNHLMEISIAWDIIDKLELDYKDLIGVLQSEQMISTFIKMYDDENIINKINIDENKLCKIISYACDNNMIHMDKMELDYKDLFFDVPVSMIPNVDISFNDVIRVTYED